MINHLGSTMAALARVSRQRPTRPLQSNFADTVLGTPVWQHGLAERPSRPRLDRDLDADVAIVGAGFTGLWAAYYLLSADPSLRVVIVDQAHAGFGASGRNGGWCSAIFPVSMGRVAAMSSRREALELQRALNETVGRVGQVVRHEGIECDYRKGGYVGLARSRAQWDRAQEVVARNAELGLGDQWNLLTSDEALAMVNATHVSGGLWSRHCATLQPYLLARGLAASAERLGAAIYEYTPARSLSMGRVVTAGGTVRAEVVVRATEAYTSALDGHRRQVAPLYSMAMATEPLPASLIENLVGRDGTAFNDLRHLRIYCQQTIDGRLVFGGRGAPYHFASQIDQNYETSEKILSRLFEAMRELFPALSSASISHAWGGPLGVPRDWYPSVGLDDRSGYAWGGPYVGDGVALSNLAGRLISDLILRRTEETDLRLPLVNHRSPSWPWEPFRWLGINLGLRSAAFADFEEQLSGRPSIVAALLEKLTGAH